MNVDAVAGETPDGDDDGAGRRAARHRRRRCSSRSSVVGVASVPLNRTVLVPCVAPKFAPVIVTAVPTGPDVGASVVIVGGTVTVNGTPLLARPPTVTTTLPVVAPLGTGTAMLVALQLVGVAACR